MALLAPTLGLLALVVIAAARARQVLLARRLRRDEAEVLEALHGIAPLLAPAPEGGSGTTRRVALPMACPPVPRPHSPAA